MGFRFDGQADIAAGGRQLRRRCWLGGAARPVLALVAANNRLAGATGLEPATFGVTGRIKFNGIKVSCKFFCV